MADSNVGILLTGDSKDAVDSIKKTGDALRGLQDTGTKTDSTFTKMFASGGIAGLSKRDFRENIMGLSTGLEAVAKSAGGADSELAKAATSGAQFISAMAYTGTVGAILMGVGMALGKLTEKTPQVEALGDKLKKLAEVDAAVAGLMQLTGMTEAQATTALEAAGNNQEYARRLKELTDQAQTQSPIVQTLTDAWNGFITFMKGGLEALSQAASLIVGTGAYVTQFVLALKEGAGVSEAVAKAENMGAQATQWFYEKVRTSTTATKENTEAQAKLKDLVAEAPKYTKEASKANEEYAASLKRIDEATQSVLKGMVEKALTPTSVTDEDTKATKAGTYTNKWDEFRRRIEAVTKGTNPAQFGVEFEAALSKLNMPLDVAAEKFKNFSLFADPKNLKLVDWGAMTASVGDQLMQLVGKANLMKEGFAKAWAGLSADQRKSLRELGIESAGDAKKALMGTAASGVDGFTAQIGDKETQKQLKSAGGQLVKSVQAGALDKETMKTWLGTVDALVTNAIAQFQIKENVKLLFDAGVSMLDQIAAGLKSSNALSDALLKVVDKAIQDALAAIQESLGGGGGGGGSSGFGQAAIPVPASYPGFAGGGVGVFAKGGYVHVDDGEGYALTGRGGGLPRLGGGGGNVTIVYAPQVSLASRQEAVGVLAPIVQQALREANSRKAS